MSEFTTHTHTFMKKDAKYEDTKSTAFTFLFIGALGLIFILLLNLNLLPLHMEGFMKGMMSFVMGGLFFIFLIIGIVYQSRLKSLKAAVSEENQFTEELTSWFLTNYDANKIDAKLAGKTELTENEASRYYARYEICKQLISDKYPSINESYLDHMIDELYQQVFGE